MSILLALVIFSVLVLFHEFGHFLFAKLNHITVLEFSLGMGPKLLSFEKGGTLYCLKLFPFGGSCMMQGEDGEDETEGSFNAAPVWGRISVVAAGPIFNFILAFLFAMVVVGISGFDRPVVTTVEEGSAAEAAGLQVGDQITKFDGYGVSLGRDLYMYMNLVGAPDDQVRVEYLRDGVKQSLVYVPDSEERYMLGFNYYADEQEPLVASVSLGGAMAEAGVKSGDVILELDGTAIHTGAELEKYMADHPMDGSVIHMVYKRGDKVEEADVTPSMHMAVDIGFGYNMAYEKADALGVLRYGFEEVKYWIKTTVLSLRMLVTGKVGINDMSGPVGIVDAVDKTYQSSRSAGMKILILNLLDFAILLTANLGIMNLLPIPALDGGRLVFLFVEAVRGKRVPPEKEGMVHFAGLAVLMVLMVVVMYNDIVKLL